MVLPAVQEKKKEKKMKTFQTYLDLVIWIENIKICGKKFVRGAEKY